MKIFVIFALVLSFNGVAHEGHSVPGAIPPAPHGGVLKEAKHKHAGSHKNHSHKKAMKMEIFYEAIYKNGVIKVFPLELNPKGHRNFISLGLSNFSQVKAEVIDPRKKKNVKFKLKKKATEWELVLNKKRHRRLIVHFSGVYHGAKFSAKIQVERK